MCQVWYTQLLLSLLWHHSPHLLQGTPQVWVWKGIWISVWHLDECCWCPDSCVCWGVGWEWVVEKEGTVFLIMGIITVTFVPAPVPVIKMHGAQCTIHTPYQKKRKCTHLILQSHMIKTALHIGNLLTGKWRAKGMFKIKLLLSNFFLQVVTKLHTFQEVTGELVLDFYSEIP